MKFRFKIQNEYICISYIIIRIKILRKSIYNITNQTNKNINIFCESSWNYSYFKYRSTIPSFLGNILQFHLLFIQLEYICCINSEFWFSWSVMRWITGLKRHLQTKTKNVRFLIQYIVVMSNCFADLHFHIENNWYAFDFIMRYLWNCLQKGIPYKSNQYCFLLLQQCIVREYIALC